MLMKSYWITHKGKRIFITDFSNCGTNADMLRKECDAVKTTLASEPAKSVCTVVNIDGTFVNEGILQAVRETIPVTNKYVKRRAIIGLSGFRKHFIFLVSKFVGDVNYTPFDTLNEALDWIVLENL